MGLFVSKLKGELEYEEPTLNLTRTQALTSRAVAHLAPCLIRSTVALARIRYTVSAFKESHLTTGG